MITEQQKKLHDRDSRRRPPKVHGPSTLCVSNITTGESVSDNAEASKSSTVECQLGMGSTAPHSVSAISAPKRNISSTNSCLQQGYRPCLTLIRWASQPGCSPVQQAAVRPWHRKNIPCTVCARWPPWPASSPQRHADTLHWASSSPWLAASAAVLRDCM